MGLALLLLCWHCVASLFFEARVAHIRLFLLFGQGLQLYCLPLFFLTSSIDFSRRRNILTLSLFGGIVSVLFVAPQSGLVQLTPIFGFKLLDSPVDFLVAHNIKVLIADRCLLLVLSLLKVLNICDVHCLGFFIAGLREICIPTQLRRKGRKASGVGFASFRELLGIAIILPKFVILFIERLAKI